MRLSSHVDRQLPSLQLRLAAVHRSSHRVAEQVIAPHRRQPKPAMTWGSLTIIRRGMQGFATTALASSAAFAQRAAAQLHDYDLLPPVDAGEEGAADDWFAPEPEPSPPPPPPREGSQCHFWEYCWKLTIPDTLVILLIFGLCIIGSFYVLNNCCCYEDPALQQARYEKLKAQRRAREAAEGLAAQATRPPDPSELPYSQGGQSRPYGQRTYHS
jgi:hypothetical protein